MYSTDVYAKNMRVSILPKTPLGKWSTGFIVAFVLLFVAFLLLVASGQRGGETFFSNLVLTIPMLLAGTSGVFAFLTGLISVIRNRERSILVFLAMLIGLFVLLFGLGEIIFPH
jgi:hypothetical protein